MQKILKNLIFVSVSIVSGCISVGAKNEKADSDLTFTGFDRWLYGLSRIEGITAAYDSEMLKDCEAGIDEFSCNGLGEEALKALNIEDAVRFFARGCYYGETYSCAHLAVMDKSKNIGSDRSGEYYKNIAELACPDAQSSGCVNLGWYLSGMGEFEEAKLYNKAACTAGEGAGCYNLAWLILKDNPAEGEKYLKLACLFNFGGGCVDYGIRAYNAGLKEIGKDYVHSGYETSDKYCGENGDAEVCHSIAEWYKISHESDEYTELIKDVKAMVEKAVDHGATEKIIKFRENNPQLFIGISKNYSNSSFKTGEVYKGYYFCEQVVTGMEIEIKKAEESNVTAIFKVGNESAAEFDTSGFNDSFPEIYKFSPVKEVSGSEDYELPGFSGFLDAGTGEFYGKVEGETCGLFLTAESKAVEAPSYSEFDKMFHSVQQDSTFRKFECNLKDKTKEEFLSAKFGEKGVKIIELINGVKTAEQIMNESGADRDFILKVLNYIKRCGWISLSTAE